MSNCLPPRAPPSPLAQVHTIRTLTGSDVFPRTAPPLSSPSPISRYSRQNILIFRTADGEERYVNSSRSASPMTLCNMSMTNTANQTNPSTSSNFDDLKPRISSVTDSSNPSFYRSPMPKVAPMPVTRFPDVHTTPLGPVETDEDEEDMSSTYSHASAFDMDELDEEDLAGIRNQGMQVSEMTPTISRQLLEIRRQSFVRSFARARETRDGRIVLCAKSKREDDRRCVGLRERCINAISELLDMNVAYSRLVMDRFNAFSTFFTMEEKHVISELLKESSNRLKREAPSPWRAPLWASKRTKVIPNYSANQIAGLFRGSWVRKQSKLMNSETLMRSVVFGNHIIPGVQSAESILLRMAGEYQREAFNRKATRAERIDIPLSFAMTLLATLATFSRLDCATSYRRYRSRSASNRKGNPQIMILIKTKYDGLKLSFGVTLHGESPCTVLFRRPRIFSLRKIDDYANLVTEAKDIMLEFGREIAMKQ